MAFDKNIVDAVRKKYGVDMESNAKWWGCAELWNDPEFAEYLGSNYDERIVKAVEQRYGISVKNWRKHEKLLCQDFDFGSYFVQLRKIGWREIARIMNEPRPYRSTDSISKERDHFPDLSGKKTGLREFGIIPVLPDMGR